MLKINENCPAFEGKVFCSQGIGRGYEKSTNARRNRYQGERTIETYKAENGRELPMPKYYHDKIYSEEEREKLWIIKQERGYRYIGGEKCSIGQTSGDGGGGGSSAISTMTLDAYLCPDYLNIFVAQVYYRDWETDRKSTRLNSSHSAKSRMPSSA